MQRSEHLRRYENEKSYFAVPESLNFRRIFPEGNKNPIAKMFCFGIYFVSLQSENQG
jgi:hypothetical protein